MKKFNSFLAIVTVAMTTVFGLTSREDTSVGVDNARVAEQEFTEAHPHVGIYCKTRTRANI